MIPNGDEFVEQPLPEQFRTQVTITTTIIITTTITTTTTIIISIVTITIITISLRTQVRFSEDLNFYILPSNVKW